MKRFLIPLDFSENAQVAFEYALSMAKDMNIQLFLLVHIQKSSLPKSMDTENESSQPVGASIIEQLATKAEAVLGEGTTVLTKVLRGEPAEIIERLARQFEADLVIMGSTGDDRFSHQEAYLGSVSSAVLKNTQIPLLFVPPEFGYQKPSSISLLLRSLVIKKKEALMPLEEIALKHQSKINIAQLAAESFGKKETGKSNISLTNIDYALHHIACKHVLEGVKAVVDDYKPDMLVVLRRNRDFFENLFKGNVISVEDFNCKLPLLVLHEAR
jgi:nucleotide-binding universal stress UspA family protein